MVLYSIVIVIVIILYYLMQSQLEYRRSAFSYVCLRIKHDKVSLFVLLKHVSREVGSRLKFISKNISSCWHISSFKILRNGYQKYEDTHHRKTAKTHMLKICCYHIFRIMMHVKFIQMTKTYPTFILVVLFDLVDNE